MAIFEDREKLADLCQRWHVKRLSLFGSRLKGLDRPDSDVDLLVEFEARRSRAIWDSLRSRSSFRNCSAA